VETTLFALLAEGVVMSFFFDRLIKRIEREHRQRVHTMQTFISEAPAAIAMLDLDMRYIAVSKRWIADYQLEGKEVLGRTHYEVFPEIPTRWKEVHKRCLAGAVERDDSDLFVRGDGTQQWLSWEVRPWFEEPGKSTIGGIFMFSEDITAMKEAHEKESTLRAKAYIDSKLRIEAERASKQKDDFVVTLSHELRTPLNAMLGWTQLLQRVRDDPGRLSQALSAIERSGRVLAQLISDILDINRISLGKLRLHIESISLESLLQSAFDTALPQAEANNITLEKNIATSGVSLRGDPVRLQQCLWNLLSNAIRFTPSGGRVTISAGIEGDAVQISVSDTGRGIPPEQLPRLFNQFAQAHPASTRAYSGLGLGLALVRQLVELHGGSVAADSPGEGKGSTLTITLPCEVLGEVSPPVTETRRLTTSEANCSGRLILVVDDEMEAREFLRGMLEGYGAQVYTATSAANGITIASRCPIDLIISDIAMPERDGCDLMRDVRAAGIAVPAIALSAYTDSTQVARALGAGFDRCLAKPVKLEELVATLQELLGQQRDLSKAS
jgi:PAS domain S-box-containing protein